MKRLLITTAILAFVGCGPKEYLGPLDSPLGNWEGKDSKYYFAGEYVYEDQKCTYSAISFYQDSLCCIEGVKGAFKWTYDESTLVVDSTSWNVVDLSGQMMALDFIGRILPEGGSEESVTTEYKGKTIHGNGKYHWYVDSSGKTVHCWPVEISAEDGTPTVACWWDTRSDFYKPF